MEEITFELTIEETNKILAALGKLPYVQVFELIHKIQDQARSQVGNELTDESGAAKDVSVDSHGKETD